MQYSNILIIQTAFIGDAILASSLAETLHTQFPSAKLSLLVRQGNEGIYSQHPYLEEVLIWNKKKRKSEICFHFYQPSAPDVLIASLIVIASPVQVC